MVRNKIKNVEESQRMGGGLLVATGAPVPDIDHMTRFLFSF
jgi:hypothetical protein